MSLILASQSPRRRELLGLYHIPFEVRVADIDETMNPELSPQSEVARVSRAKALAVPHEESDTVIAADTIVVCDGRILGKPHSKQEAAAMLTMLSGRTHQVMTGYTLLHNCLAHTATEVTDVCFRRISPQEIARYVESGEPMDKAGAYGIQGGAAVFVERIRGDYYNVVGLPVCALWQMLCRNVPELMEGRK